MSDARRGIECAHEKDKADIESGEGVRRNIIVLLTVHRAQQVVAGLKNPRDALEDSVLP